MPVADAPERDASSPSAIDRVLSLIDESPKDQSLAPRERPSAENAALVAGFVQSRTGKDVQVQVLGHAPSQTATIADHMDLELVDRASAEGDLALLCHVDGCLQLIGVVQTKLPRDTVIRGRNIVVEADEQLTLRSGRAAIQLRSDGAIEMLGTRIAATSRGVFRLIGRALRLN